MSNDKHILTDDPNCPVCESEWTTGGAWENEGNEVWQKRTCDICESIWFAYHKLHEVTIVAFGEPPKIKISHN